METKELLTFEDMLELYRKNSELSKFTSFDDSDYYVSDSMPLMTTLLKIINEHIFTTQKILIPNEVKTMFGNVIGIFNFEFSDYMIIHQNRQRIYSLKIEKLLQSKTLEELKENADLIQLFIGYKYDKKDILTAIENKEAIKLESLKNSIKNEFDLLFGDGHLIINSIEDFVCCHETAFYIGSFLLNAKKIYNEVFIGFIKELSSSEKFEYLIKMFRTDYNIVSETIKYEDIKLELINNFKEYIDTIVGENEINVILTDNFWNDITNVLVNYLLQFVKEVSIEGMFNFKNTKLRIKNTDIINILRGLCPRDSVYTFSQINFLRYISTTRTNLKQILSKNYGYVDNETNPEAPKIIEQKEKTKRKKSKKN